MSREATLLTYIYLPALTLTLNHLISLFSDSPLQAIQ